LNDFWIDPPFSHHFEPFVTGSPEIVQDVDSCVEFFPASATESAQGPTVHLYLELLEQMFLQGTLFVGNLIAIVSITGDR
jgi:hypothetical protein